MYKKIFFDANIILDIFDIERPAHKASSRALIYCIENEIEILTSCDIITTIYYIESKKNRSKALEKIIHLNKSFHIVEFSNREVEKTCTLMIEDSDYSDLEDTIQVVLARKESCDLIVSNDKTFVSKELPLLTSEKFMENLQV